MFWSTRLKKPLTWLVAALAAASLPIWLAIASPNGDLWGQWTDHLRHEGEAIAFERWGLGISAHTYHEATAGLTLPCPDHAGLWGTTGVPYPPLGILIHWPIARLERAGVISPPTAHGILVWMFGVAGLAAAALGASMLSGWRRALFVVLFAPLLAGAGFSGFYDTLWVLAALFALKHDSRAAAVLAYLLHFRGLVALTFPNFRSGARGTLLALAAVGFNTASALVAASHLGLFEINSRLHYTRMVAWWFPAATGVVWCFVRREGFGVPLLVTAAILFVDRQASFWHLLLLVPLAVSIWRSGSSRSALLITGWLIVTAQAFLDTYTPFPMVWLMR